MSNWLKALVKTLFLANRNNTAEFYSRLPTNENIKLTTADNETVWGLLIKPESISINSETKCFVVCHGKGIDRVNALGLSGLRSRLGSVGNTCFFMIDYRNFGGSTGDFNIEDVSYDVDAAVKYLQNEYNVQDIRLVGHSLGGGVVLKYMEFLEKTGSDFRPKALYCFATFTSIMDCLMELWSYRILRWVIPYLRLILPGDFGYDNRKTLSSAKALGAALYLFHGKKDPTVNYTHSEILAYDFRSAHLKLFEEENHDSIFSNKECWEQILEVSL